MKIRIYFEDTDAVGIVYYANYLKFASRAKTEFFREKGCNLGWTSPENMYGFVVRHCEVDYKASARIDDLIEISTEIEKVQNTSIVLKQMISLGEKELVTVRTVLAYVGKDFKSSSLPQDFLDKI